MRVDITYVNNAGASMQFGGMDASLHYFQHDLRSNVWEFKTSIAKNRISSFTRSIKEKKFPVGIMAKTADEAISKSNFLAQLGEYDIATKRPGRLYVGDWYLSCWIVGVSFTNYWLSDNIAEAQLKLVCEACEWIHENTRQFSPQKAENLVLENGHDFPFDFNYDLAATQVLSDLDVAGVFDSSFLWRVYGPAINPYIRIGNNTYQVNVTVQEGQILEVDTMRKTVELIDSHGTRTSVFAERQRGYQGSGTYLFEALKPGKLRLSYDNTFMFDIVVYELQSLPPFELEKV